MRLRDPLLALSVVSSAALRMILGSRSFQKGHLFGITVLLAVNALAPARMSASVQCPLPPFEQEVVSAIRAQDEVPRSIVGANVIEVVNFFLSPQKSTERAFNYQNVLKHIPATICAWMFRRANQHISMTIGSDTTTPIGITFAAMPSHRVTDAEQHGFTFPLDPPSPIVTPLRNGSMTSTSTSAESRRVRQAALQVRVQAAKITISTRRTYV